MRLKKLLLYFLLCSFLVADDDIKSLLDEMTEIATKTKLNIDYQPSVVSVLYANKLKRIGVKNLHEAIALLPGIETSILHTGWKQVIFRGAYNPDTFIFDKYKLYIDGVDIGSNLYSTSYYYLDFPIELISRIEVLRGSASTVYGPGAFSGAINVITKSSKKDTLDTLFASTGSYGYHKGGFVKHVSMNDWHIALDAYYQADNKTVDADASFISAAENNYQRTEYRSLENFKDFSLGFIAQNDAFQITTRYKSEKTDNFYGMQENLEPVTGGYQHNQSAIIDIKNSSKINDTTKLNTKVGINFYSFTFDTTLYNDLQGSGIKFQINPTYEQLNSYIDLNVNTTFLNKHQIMLGAMLQKAKTTKNEFITSYRDQTSGPQTFGVAQPLTGQYGFLNGNINQIMKSIYFQDIYSINNNFDIALNARLDDYSLFEQMYSYRVSSIYRLDDNNIFKAIYGRSFRAPSFVEAFQADQTGFKDGNPNLKPEKMDTYEIAYTYKNSSTLLRTNAFYSIMNNVIDSVSNEPDAFVGDYHNHQKRTSKGMEVEFKYMFKNNAELMMNLSYIKTQFYSPDYVNPLEYQSPQISEVLSKGYLLYPLTRNIHLNTAWYYSGPKNPYPSNETTIGETLVLDETVAYDFDATSAITFSVKNLFDTTILYPSYQGKNGVIKREGRNWLLTYERSF